MKIVTPRLRINCQFVCRIVKQYNKIGDIVDRLMEGLLHSVCLRNVIHTIRKCVQWNVLHKQKRMTAKMSTSTQKMSRILYDDLKLGAYRCYVSHALTPRLKRNMSNSLCNSSATIKGEEISKHPLHRWKDFFYREKLNHQNDRVYA